jgi:sterol desaturase/sphingolipid hydroxylase (fatty acid hydroxylase superfamily)
MQFISSDQARLWVLLIACACIWSLESVIPLRTFQSRRWSRAWPNLGLTAVLVLTNLALSFALAQVATLVQQQRVGLFQMLPSATWLKLLLGVVGLDLFSYLAHVLMHKSPFGWRFHRVHHSEPEVDVTTAFRQHPGKPYGEFSGSSWQSLRSGCRYGL